MARLHQKLSYIMAENKITDAAVATAVHSDRSTVNKWRHNKLLCRREVYGRTLAACLCQAVDPTWLRELLGLGDPGGDLAPLLEGYLFDDSQDLRAPAPAPEEIQLLKDRMPSADAGCFLDVEGLLDALYLFRQRIQQEPAPPPIAVYLSSDNCRVLLDEKMAPVWNDLYLLNGRRPVRMILEGCGDDERFREMMRHFMPEMQTGRLELWAIASADRYFCYHLSFLCQDTCMVMATEPAAAFGACVSFYVESPAFVGPMSRTMAKLGGIAKPMARGVQSAKGETTRLGDLLERDGALRALFGGPNLLYLPVDALRELLRLGGLSYARRKYPLERFRAQKEQFEAFLKTGEYLELVSLAALDDSIRTGYMTVPDLSLPLAGRIPAGAPLLRELLEGMLDYSRRYPGLQFLLVRDLGEAVRRVTCRIREEQTLLLNLCLGEAKYCLHSDHWLFVGEYNRLLEEAARGPDVIRAPHRVQAVLAGRIKRLSESLS